MRTRIPTLVVGSLLMAIPATAIAQQVEGSYQDPLIAEFQARSAALTVAVDRADATALDSLLSPGFEASFGLAGGTLLHVPRASWLRRAPEIAGLEQRTIIARLQGDVVVVTSRHGPERAPRYIVTDVWGRVGESWQLVWRQASEITHSGA